ncbi:MAG: hypothetical protein Q8T04_21045 [Bacteroidota bacterium]|nr:hypothetical protein [Bacteroidota bacterium]
MDLEDIAEYIAKDSVKYASITVSGIIQDAVRLNENPYQSQFRIILPQFPASIISNAS